MNAINIFLPKLKQFFTTWCLVLWMTITIINKNYKLPNFLLVFAQNLILTTSYFGYYILTSYGHNILKKYKDVKNYQIQIVNIITHILPLIYIKYVLKKIYVVNDTKEFLLILSISGLLIKKYLSMYNPEKIYWFTKFSKKKLISSAVIFYIMLFFVQI